MEMLRDHYSIGNRIDNDAEGGYARVIETKEIQTGYSRAMKIMRHELLANEEYRKGATTRFQEELLLLSEIMKKNDIPFPITKIYDSGFVPVDLSRALEELAIPPDFDSQIYRCGLDVSQFNEVYLKLQKEESQNWIPYIVVELAPYNDSLYRQIQNRALRKLPIHLSRLHTIEVVTIATELLKTLSWFHKNQERAYIDWKPEHIFWDGKKQKTKLIDWNVTVPLEENPGREQNIRDDLRLFSGAVLYTSLTFVDPEDFSRPIGPRPTEAINSPIPEARRRYWTTNPNFYEAGDMLDDEIVSIIKKGLDLEEGYNDPEELSDALVNYSNNVLGLSLDKKTSSLSGQGYIRAIEKIRDSQDDLLAAREEISSSITSSDNVLEYARVLEVIDQILRMYPTY